MNNMNQPYIPSGGYAPYQENLNMYQQRLNNMAQQITGQGQQGNYNNAFSAFAPISSQMNGFGNVHGQNFNVRVVTGYEEAMASQTPLDGSVSILIDRSHDMIFTKQLNMNDGTPLVKRYKMQEMPKEVNNRVENDVEYVEKKEFDELKERFDEVWTALTEKPEQNQKQSTTNKKEAAK